MKNNPLTYKKILIFGATNSGKSTLAKTLSKKLKIRHYDMDDIFWKRKYDKKRTDKECKKLLKIKCKKKQWIIEGAYSRWVECAVKSADLIILLKIPLRKLAFRLTKRTIKRKLSKDKKIRTRESLKDYKLLLRFAKIYGKKKNVEGYETHKQLSEKHKKEFIIIKNNKDIKKLLKSHLSNSIASPP